MAQQVIVDKEIIESLKVNHSGWDIQLFDDQNSLKSCICSKCKSVCCDAVELGCDHDDDDIYLYCRTCLEQLVVNNANKCPIDGHEEPIIAPSRALRRQISKLIVYCPYSNACDAKDNDAEGVIMNTVKGICELKTGCEWKGTLKDLIHKHITLCTQQNDPSFSLKKQIKELQHENEKLQQKNIALQKKLNEQSTSYDDNIARLKAQNVALQKKLNAEMLTSEQYKSEMEHQSAENKKLQQQITELIHNKNISAHNEDTENKNDDIVDQPTENQCRWRILIVKGESYLKGLNSNAIQYNGKSDDDASWFSFGEILKGKDNIIVKFEIENDVDLKPDESMHRFGFGHQGGGTIDISNDGECHIDGEFAKLNNKETMERLAKSLNLIPINVSTVVFEVDMKQRKGWIGNGSQRIEINLPDQVEMTVFILGKGERCITAKVLLYEQ